MLELLELLGVVFDSRTTALAFGANLDSALVGRRVEVQLDDSDTQVLGKFEKRKWSAGLDDDGLETIVEHAGRDELKLLRSNELDRLAEAGDRSLSSKSVAMPNNQKKRE